MRWFGQLCSAVIDDDQGRDFAKDYFLRAAEIDESRDLGGHAVDRVGTGLCAMARRHIEIDKRTAESVPRVCQAAS